MKEEYFTTENIDQESNEMIEEVKYYSGMRLASPDNGHIALLVVDMQNYFLDNTEHAFIPSGPTIVPNVVKIMKACTDLNIPIFLTQHVNTDDDAGMMGVNRNNIIAAS